MKYFYKSFEVILAAIALAIGLLILGFIAVGAWRVWSMIF